jgi:hypothetical protein
MNNPADFMRNAIQQLLNTYGDGWILDDFVLAVGLQRLSGEQVESTVWTWAPPDQADWKTEGLLRAAEELCADCDTTD